MMGIGRDDFSKLTKDTLAKRVGFLCSNPSCRKPTVGSNEIPTKSTSIGVAAHITAASKGGPRYDKSISDAERVSFDNAIWLCNNCATLIDKDPEKYTIETLRKWKADAEIDSSSRIRDKAKELIGNTPYLEVDLINRTRSRLHENYSNKNPLRTDESGIKYYDVSERPIIHWLLVWKYNLTIYNNSNAPAYNVRIESIGKINFKEMDNLPKINNIPPLAHTVLTATYEERVEGDHFAADKILKPRIPEKLEDLVLKLTYFDDTRNPQYTLVEINDHEILNNKVKE
jgi:hypothetical protein